MSKGSRRRPEDRKRLDRNWDKIKWRSKVKPENRKDCDGDFRSEMADSMKVER